MVWVCGNGLTLVCVCEKERGGRDKGTCIPEADLLTVIILGTVTVNNNFMTVSSLVRSCVLLCFVGLLVVFKSSFDFRCKQNEDR